MVRTQNSQRCLRPDRRALRQGGAEGCLSFACQLQVARNPEKGSHPAAGHNLGFAPGSWSRATNWLIGEHGRLIASDMQLMSSMSDVTFIRGEFSEGVVSSQILAAIGEYPVDLVISDMAPNMCGVRSADQSRAMCLGELASIG